MIARSIALNLLLAKFAFGLDASQSPDQIAHSNHVETDNQPTSALVAFAHDTDAGAGVDVAVKRTGLRGFNGVATNLSAKTGSIDAGGTVPATKIERGNRLVGASAWTDVGLDVSDGAGGEDKNFVGVGRVLRDCSTTPSWHPNYSVSWDGGYCTFETNCDSPGYGSELACCKAAYTGQTSGYCLSMLESPPTTSPTASDFTVEFWYPDYDTAWPSAGCLNTLPLPNNIKARPNYPTQFECCKAVYAGQISGTCLSQLESPPTTSPTNTGNTGSLFYPDYETAWPDAGCLNVLPVPGGRPTYTSHIACCKGAYGGQVSGVCLSQLQSPPTTSPSSAGGLDVYYPDYDMAWDKAACVNTRPMPSGRPVYSTMLACCKSAYAGQMSGHCLSQLEAPPTTSPTSNDFTADFWYPDYDTAWPDAGCLNSLPLPYSPGGRPTYTTNEACCSTAYGGQVSKTCLCSMASPPADCVTTTVAATTTPGATTTQAATTSTPPFFFTTNAELRAAIKEYLGQGCTNDVNCQARSDYGGAIGDWDVSSVADFSSLFVDDSGFQITGADAFNEPINWDTGSATGMSYMFMKASAFNQPLTFDTAKVTDITGMFLWATAFNQDLCHFGDNFATFSSYVSSTFVYSGCSNKNDPTSETGPWCAVTTCPPSHSFTTNAELRTAIQEYLSQGCTNDVNCQARSDYGGAIGDWDVSSVADFSNLFEGATGADAFNEPINWDTGSATSMHDMFYEATAFNQPLPFDTAKVTDMYGMFYEVEAFNQPLSFNTAEVTDMSYMFGGATAFNQPLSFDTTKVTNMRSMFGWATAFNQALYFDTTNVTRMDSMFMRATAFNQPLPFDTAKVLTMASMFHEAEAFNQPLSFNTAEVTDMRAMFLRAVAFNQDLCHFGQNFSQINKQSIFTNSGCSYKNEPTSSIGPWCAVLTCPSPHSFTTNAELRTAILEYLSQGCTNNVNCQARSNYGGAIGDWDVSSVADFSRLFVDDSGLQITGADAFNEPIHWDTGSATIMSHMFMKASAFNQPLPFDTAQVTDMAGMFYGAEAFNQPLPFDTAEVEYMGQMFTGATAFNQPLSFNTAKVTRMGWMFEGAAAFNQPLPFDTAKVIDMRYMFGGATAFNQDLCHFGDNFSQIDKQSIFTNSGCSNKNDPTNSTGPWCAVTTCA